MRPDQGIPKVAVLLTDGYSNGRALGGPANQLRKLGVNIFSIGVGHNVNPKELKLIASDPDSTHVFQMGSFNDLAGWVDKLSAVSCDGKWYNLNVDHNLFQSLLVLFLQLLHVLFALRRYGRLQDARPLFHLNKYL